MVIAIMVNLHCRLRRSTLPANFRLTFDPNAFRAGQTTIFHRVTHTMHTFADPRACEISSTQTALPFLQSCSGPLSARPPPIILELGLESAWHLPSPPAERRALSPSLVLLDSKRRDAACAMPRVGASRTPLQPSRRRSSGCDLDSYCTTCPEQTTAPR